MLLTTVKGPDGAMRLPPQVPSHVMTTFQFVRPPRIATCEEYGCPNYLNGWKTIVSADVAPVVRGLRGYSFTETAADGGLVEFLFPAGQECFESRSCDPDRQHRLPWEGRERFFERGGDWRGNPRGEVREFTRADDWVDRFATHQIGLAEQLERG